MLTAAFREEKSFFRLRKWLFFGKLLRLIVQRLLHELRTLMTAEHRFLEKIFARKDAQFFGC